MNEKELTKLPRPSGLRRNFKAYLFIMSAPIYLYHSLATKDYWTLLFISCLALYAPILWTAFAIYLCCKTCNQFQQSNLIEKENIQNVIVQSVKLNHLEVLTKAIEENPDILYCDYQRRSLIAWCRYYKNTRAQELIMQMMIKYPKESLAA